MGRRKARTRLAAMRARKRIGLLATVFAISLAGCGGSDEGTIPSDQSDTLLGLLDQVQNSVSVGDCDLAQKNAEELVDTVNNLPAEVDNEVQGALTRASEQLANLAENPDECVDEGTSGVEGVDEDASTDPTTSETTPSEEEPAEEEPAPVEEEEPSPPSGGDQGPPDTVGPGTGDNGGVGPPSGGLEPPDGKR